MTGFPGPEFPGAGLSGSGLSGTWGEMFAQAQKLVRELNPALESFVPGDLDKLWPVLPRGMMDLLWGDRLNPGGLDARTRLLVLLAGMVVQGAPAEPQFRATLRHALAAGASQKEIAEVIVQMALLGGLPATGRAMAMAQEVFREQAAGDGHVGAGASPGRGDATTGDREPER